MYTHNDPKTGNPMVGSGRYDCYNTERQSRKFQHGQSYHQQQRSDPAMVYIAKQHLFSKSTNPFSGGSNFSRWSKEIMSSMQGIQLSPYDMLKVLANNTAGTPHDIINDYVEGSEYIDEETIDFIWKILHDRYGSKKVSSSLLDRKVADFPPSKNPEDKVWLGRFLDLNLFVKAQIRHLPEANKYNFSSNMKHLWQKLPEVLLVRWRTYGYEIKMRGGKDPVLDDLIEFLNVLYREINDDFFRDILPKSKSSHKTLITSTETKESNTDLSNTTDSIKAMSLTSPTTFTQFPSTYAKITESSTCPLHENSQHHISECRKFINMKLSDRKDAIWKHKLCFRCFGAHVAKSCKEAVKCNECGSNRHSTLMHDDSYSSLAGKNETPSSETKNLCTDICSSEKGKICSKTLLTFIKHRDSKKTIKGYVIIDEQSSSSFIDPVVLQELKISAPSHVYTLRTLSGLKSDVHGHLVQGLQVRGVNNHEWYKLSNVLTSSHIPDSRAEVATPEEIGKHRHLAHLKNRFPCFEPETPVLMLIGADSGEIMHTTCYGDHAPYVQQTHLGWTLVGSACTDQSVSSSNVKVLKTNIIDGMHSFSASPKFPQPHETRLDPFREFADDEDVDLSQEDKKFLSMMNDNIHIVDGKLSMPLPFKEENPNMPNNRSAVYHRTKTSLDRIKRDPAILSQCTKSIATSLEKGHIELVPTHELIPKEAGKCWFLPVFAVLHPKKNKARLVFDASANYHGVSLNNKLLQGPYLTNNLRSVLLRFRKGHIGLTCDIEHMFYNFFLEKSQRDYLRFFWYADNNEENELVQYRAKVHIFGASSSPSVASFGLQYAAMNATGSNDEKAKKFILRNFYVDDGVTSVNTVSEGISLINETKSILEQYQIRLNKIASSEPIILDALPTDDIAEDLKHIDFDDSPSKRTLGVIWDLSSDSFIAKAEVPEAPFTKRGVLSVINSYFDPIGIAAPVILGGRLIQRKVLPSKDRMTEDLKACSWDTLLPDAYIPMWEAWKSSLSDSEALRIPRCFIPVQFGQVTNRQLHVFSDASIDAIGIVAYLVSHNQTSESHTSFVTAVSKVAPKSATSVPRLELCAALLAASSACEILKEIDLQIDETKYFTDSKVVLGYLNNSTKMFTRYVTRRIEMITKVAPAERWYYIPTDVNPADLASRPTDPLTLANSRWLVGPQCLENGLYSQESSKDYSSIELPEESKEKVCLYSESKSPILSEISLLASNISSWQYIINVTQKVMAFCYKLLYKIRNKNDEVTSTPVVIDKLLYIAQKEVYPEIFDILSEKKHLPENHPICSLTPFIDDKGLIRVGGRLQNVVPFDHAHPIFIPANHPVSSLLVQHLHSKVGHQGRHITHGYIREQGYHLEKGKSFIRKLLAQCVLCRRLRGQFQGQLMADLPEDRLETCPPFTNTGVDVFGPYNIHDGINTRRTSATKKMFVLLMTCLVTRAVHLEPLSSMDTSSCINALRRFFAIRGCCRRIRSDHGTNFIGAINQTSANIDVKQLQQVAEAHQCEWVLNPPGASHFGGAIERKIGSVKRILESTLLLAGKRVLSRDEMITFLQEAACVVNSTPLYEVSSDPNDGAPITPNCLLTLKDNPQPPPLGSFTEKDLLQYGQRRWRRVQYLSDQFWIRWRSNYLQDLTARRKWKVEKRNLCAGDIVLLRDKFVPRNRWPLAIITDVKFSHDNLVRSVKIRQNNKIYERKIHDLLLLVSKV